MNIYSISWQQDEEDGHEVYDAHIIVADNEQQVVNLAKFICAEECANVWELANVKLEGIYTGSVINPFILLSSYISG